MSGKVTINMVAEKAGVSRGTVDRVLNQRPHVKPQIYRRVVQAIKELEYVPPKKEQAIALGLTYVLKKECKIGVVLPNWNGYFRKEVLRGVKSAQALLCNYSAEVIIEECETTLPEESIEKMEWLVRQGAQGLSLCAMDHKLIAAKIDEFYDRGIPVVTYNSDISNCRRLAFIGQDLVAGGRVAGELMSKYLKTSDKLLVAIANSNFNAHNLRVQGFCQCLYEHGFQKDVVKIIETYNDYSLTFQKVKGVLQREPNIKGIYMANHSVTGCVEAIRSLGISKRIHVISHDLTEATKWLLKSREIDFAIAQNIYQQGYEPLVVLQEYIQKNKAPMGDVIDQKIEIICAENL